MNILNKSPQNQSKSTEPFLKKANYNILALFILGTSFIQLIVFIQICFLNLGVFQIAKKPEPSLVQLVDGKVIRTTPMSSKERTPATIKRFVGETMALLFNWSGNLPLTPEEISLGKPVKSDPGVEISPKLFRSQKITTASWEASFAISEEFRQEFLEKLAELTPAKIFSTNTEVVLLVKYLSEPEQIEPGRWKCKMVANLVTFSENNRIGEAVSFNKEIFVQAVEIPSLPLPGGATELQRAAYRIRSAGLEIYKFKEFSPEV